MTGARVGKSHDSRDCWLLWPVEDRRGPVNVLSDNANGAAPLGTARPRLKRS